MTLDAQKIFGPKGVGLLYIKTGVEISPIIFGGGQEGGLRSGTENVPGIVGIAKALEIVRKDFEKKTQKVKAIRDYFWVKIQKEIPQAVLNGGLENRLQNNFNISIPGIDSEFTVLCLDEAGIVCSTRSACSQDENGSAVVLTVTGSDLLAKSTLRFSLGEDSSKKDIDYVVSTLKKIVKKTIKIKKEA
jgi:cysteine desulfurase